MTTRFENQFHEFGVGPMRTNVRTSRAIGQAACTILKITVDPLIASLTANVVVITEFSNRESLPQVIGDELSLQVHGG
jgi:hypothetical protein